MKLKVLIRPESVGGFSVSVPALPGCHSQGETIDEALANIREAAELWMEVASRSRPRQQGPEARHATRHYGRRGADGRRPLEALRTGGTSHMVIARSWPTLALLRTLPSSVPGPP